MRLDGYTVHLLITVTTKLPLVGYESGSPEPGVSGAKLEVLSVINILKAIQIGADGLVVV